MVNAILRTKSIGTKVTEEEYARLDELAAAAGRSRAEWVRDILIRQLEQRAAKAQEETVLAELLGLRFREQPVHPGLRVHRQIEPLDE